MPKKHKAQSIFLPENFEKDVKTFIEDYLDDNVKQSFTSEDATNDGKSLVRTVSGDQFMQEFLKNSS